MARIVLDTNVYILGFQRRVGDEWLTLQRVQQRHDVIVFSRELEDQIRLARVPYTASLGFPAKATAEEQSTYEIEPRETDE